MDLLMLDSGAYTVWSQGASIDFDDYLSFCRQNPQVSYYVVLDVILGEKGDPRTKTAENIEASCAESWKNYRRMIRVLPEEKVIPVFHKGESWDWLSKYLDFGCEYIGIGQASQGTWHDRAVWLSGLKDILLDSSGEPVVRTHGFGITSFRMMRMFPWYSVDSSSWVLAASYGNVLVPQRKREKYRYDLSPLFVNVSPTSRTVNDKDKHIQSMTPMVYECAQKYFREELRMDLGEYEIVDVPAGHDKANNEIWYDSNRYQVVRFEKKGLSTCYQRRFFANARFFQKANKVLPIEDIYFASDEGILLEPIEFRLKKRLMSYHRLRDRTRQRALFDKYMERMSGAASVV